MSASDEKPRYRVWLAAGAAVLLLLFGVGAYVLQRGDLATRRAIERLRPGMTLHEVHEALRPIREDMPIYRSGGELQFVFYGIDEFLIVAVADGRVTRIEHQPDDANRWDQLRRHWEWSFRRFGR